MKSSTASAPRGRGAYRGPRGKRGAYPISHRNRTLVLNSSSSKDQINAVDVPAGAANSETDNRGNSDSQPSGQHFVAKRDRHMQIINTNIYNHEAEKRAAAIEKTRQEASNRREEREKQKIVKYLQRQANFSSSRGGSTVARGGRPVPASASRPPLEITIGDNRYKVISGGSKLVKIIGGCSKIAPEETLLRSIQRYRSSEVIAVKMLIFCQDNTQPSITTTPKTATVGGVIFVRSKNGNLWRKGLVKTQRYDSHYTFTAQSKQNTNYVGGVLSPRNYNSKTTKKIDKACKYFTLTGIFSIFIFAHFTAALELSREHVLMSSDTCISWMDVSIWT